MAYNDDGSETDPVVTYILLHIAEDDQKIQFSKLFMAGRATEFMNTTKR
jgi:hypothetical protein